MISLLENRQERYDSFISAGVNFPLHHHQQLELYYVMDGAVEVTVRQEKRILCAGELAVIFPHQMHSYHTLERESLTFCIICDASLCGSHANTIAKYHPASPYIQSTDLHPNATYALAELMKEHRTPENPDINAPLIQLILARTLPQFSLHKNSSRDSLDLTYQIVYLIGEQFKEPLSLNALAHQIGISKYHLSHVFSEKMGMGFNEYVNRIRLNYAVDQLHNTSKSIADISLESGFESERTFYRTFKSQYQITPLQYRLQSKNHII